MLSWKKLSNASRKPSLTHFNTLLQHLSLLQSNILSLSLSLSLSLMETPNVSSTVNFVKKYPITLCGFSLLFMPSVYRLLLYFTPLLISTAIFIVAMMSWGPSMSSESGKRRVKRNDWAFNGSLKIYDEEEEEGEEDEVEEVQEVSQKGNTSEDNKQQKDISIKEKTSNVKDMKVEPIKLQEPDPDYDEESKRVGTASNSAISEALQAEPDPDLHGDRVGSVSYSTCTAEPDPDLHGERVDNACAAAEPDPDLHAGQHVQPADDQDFYAAKHLHAAVDHQHHLPAANDHHHHAEPAPTNPDHYAAVPVPDLHGECAVNAEAHFKKDDLHAAISELRQKLGMMKRAPYSDDPRQMLSHQLAERLQTLQAAAS